MINKEIFTSKIEDIANRYFNNKSKKDLIDFENHEIENSKRKKTTQKG
jgi:DNA mismatch repair protein MutS2